MDINKKEKELIYKWACEKFSIDEENKYFPPIDKDKSTYFEKRENGSRCLIEYQFDTLPEAEKALNSILEEKDDLAEIWRTVLVAALKNKVCVEDSSELQLTKENSDGSEVLPMYIYNF